MPELFPELRNAARTLRRAPSFSLLAIFVLGLGLGANLLLFNTVQALLWRPLPFPQSRQLVVLKNLKASGEEDGSCTGAQAAALAEHADTLASVGLVKQVDWESTLKDQPDLRLKCGVVSAGYFRTLGCRALAGRLFNDEEDRTLGGEERAVLTERAWRERFGLNPAVVGGLIHLGAGPRHGPVRILGIVAGTATLPFAAETQLLFPVPAADPSVRLNDNDGMYRVLARLKPERTPEQASAQAGALLGKLGISPSRVNYALRGLRQDLQPVNPGLYLMLLGASGLLLLLTAINVASLFLARALGRSRETAVRLALGASLTQLLRAQLLEAALISASGLALAFGLNAAMQGPLLVLFPDLRQMGPELLQVGPGLLGFGLGLLVVTSLSVSLVPLLQAGRPRVLDALTQGGRGASRGGHLGGRILVAGQVGVILVLLALGALLTRSLVRGLGQSVGFESHKVQVCKIELPPTGKAGGEMVSLEPGRDMGSAQDADQLNELASAIPGTRQSTFAWQAPFTNGMVEVTTAIHEGEFVPGDVNVAHGFIGAGYFRTLGAQVVAGREFTRAEVLGKAPVAVLNQAAARLLLPGVDPLGCTLHSGIHPGRITVVGVCADLRSDRLDAPAGPMVYLPFLPIFGPEEVTLVVRTDSSAKVLGQTLGQRVGAWRPGARLDSVAPLEAMAAKTVRERLRAAVLVGSFSLLGLIIGSIGLYGTLSAQAAEHRREVGIRMALGSTPLGAALRILAIGGAPVLLGAALGVGGALLAAQGIRSQLYGVEPLDLGSFLIALSLLLVGSLLAFLVPTLRTARTDPSEALRSE